MEKVTKVAIQFKDVQKSVFKAIHSSFPITPEREGNLVEDIINMESKGAKVTVFTYFYTLI